MTSSDVIAPAVPRPQADEALEVVVTSRRAEAEGVVGLTVNRASGDPLPPWEPGAHIEVLVPGGLTRQYSLCGDPADTAAWRIGVLREADGRGGSRWMADELAEDATLTVRGPRNHFPLRPAARYVFVAGGIGITPLLPMVRHAAAGDADWVLHYGGRTRASMAFLDELAAYGDRVRVYPQDQVGLLDLDVVLDAPDADVYCCGPAGLLDAVEGRAVEGRAVEGRWKSARLHVERFTPVAAEGPGTAFDVVCERSGLTVAVPPELTVLEAVRNAGIDVLSSCEEGICGTCETSVLDGEPDHRDAVLTDDEKAAGDTMMICVSRCRTARLVLDL